MEELVAHAQLCDKQTAVGLTSNSNYVTVCLLFNFWNESAMTYFRFSVLETRVYIENNFTS